MKRFDAIIKAVSPSNFDDDGNIINFHHCLNYDIKVIKRKERRFTLFFSYKTTVYNRIDHSIYLVDSVKGLDIIYNAKLQMFTFEFSNPAGNLRLKLNYTKEVFIKTNVLEHTITLILEQVDIQLTSRIQNLKTRTTSTKIRTIK